MSAPADTPYDRKVGGNDPSARVDIVIVVMTGWTPEDLISHFIMTRPASDRTRQAYRRHLTKFSEWCEANGTSFATVHTPMAARYFDEIRKNLAIATVKARYDVTRLFFAWLVSEGIRTDNPLDALRMEMPRPADRQTLTLRQIRDVWESARTCHERAIIGLLAINSMRPEELTRANISDLGTSDGHHILRIPTRNRGYQARFTVLADELFAMIEEETVGRTHGPMLTTASGGRAHRRHIYRVVKVVGKRAGLPFDVSPLSLSFSMRAIAISRGFSYSSVVRAVGEIEGARLAKWLDRAPDPISDHAALRMTRLVIGSGDDTLDYLMHAQVMLRGPDAPPAVAAAFAGAALERHLRALLDESAAETLAPTRAKLGAFAARLSQLGVLTSADVQLVAKIQQIRDVAAHGWFDQVTPEDAAWVIHNARNLAIAHPVPGSSTSSKQTG